MLRRRPTYEEILKEAMTSRLRILPERQKRTQQGIFIDDVDFNDFDLSRYDRKEIASNNPEKGTQTDLFDNRSSTETSESMKSLEKEYTQSIEVESEPTQAREPDTEREEPERQRGKSMIHRLYDAMFGEDEYKEEREELRNRRQQIEQEEEQIQEQIEEEKDASSDASRGSRDLPMNVKKSYQPSSSSSSSSRRSSTNRSVLLPIEENALSEHIHSSPPVSVQSSIQSNRTIEYVEEQTPPQSIISSRRSQETIEYIRSRSSRSTST